MLTDYVLMLQGTAGGGKLMLISIEERCKARAVSEKTYADIVISLQ